MHFDSIVIFQSVDNHVILFADSKHFFFTLTFVTHSDIRTLYCISAHLNILIKTA